MYMKDHTRIFLRVTYLIESCLLHYIVSPKLNDIHGMTRVICECPLVGMLRAWQVVTRDDSGVRMSGRSSQIHGSQLSSSSQFVNGIEKVQSISCYCLVDTKLVGPFER
jgi:hypothetical protein